MSSAIWHKFLDVLLVAIGAACIIVTLAVTLVGMTFYQLFGKK